MNGETRKVRSSLGVGVALVLMELISVAGLKHE